MRCLQATDKVIGPTLFEDTVVNGTWNRYSANFFEQPTDEESLYAFIPRCFKTVQDKVWARGMGRTLADAVCSVQQRFFLTKLFTVRLEMS
jgi:hypothetical protein